MHREQDKPMDYDALCEHVEDLNDEIRSLKRKLSQKDEELRQALEGGERKPEQESVDEFGQELSDLRSSVSFVQEILTAPASVDDMTRQLYSYVRDLSVFIRRDLRDAVVAAVDVSPQTDDMMFGSGLNLWSATARKTWLKGKVTIAFVGEFTAGKTTIVNRLLMQDDNDAPQLPVSTDVTTAVPTYISDGPEMMFRFVTNGNVLREISESTFSNVSHKILDRVKGVSSLIKYFLLICRLPSLKNISILDTPGFNSNKSDDTARTIAVINECDALFWVLDCNMGGINQSSLEIIRKYLKKPLYIVVNKVDTMSEKSAAMVEGHVADTLAQAGVKYEKIIRFSHKMPVSAITSAISDVQKIDMREKYPAELKSFIESTCSKLSEEVSVLEDKVNAFGYALRWTYMDFSNILHGLEDDFVSALKIPQKNVRIFQDDNFVMSQDEFLKMADIFKNIVESKCPVLDRKCEDIITFVDKYKQTYGEYERKLNNFTNLEKLKERLDAWLNKLS